MRGLIGSVLLAHVALTSSLPSLAGSVDCEITSLAQEYRVGDAPQLSVKLINHGSEVIYLVGSLDGSEGLVRYPHAAITASGPSGATNPGFVGPCGTTNPLRPEDFVRLEPGASFDPYMRVDDKGFFSSAFLFWYRFNVPGAYTFVFHYSTKSKRIKDWGGVEWVPGLSFVERRGFLLTAVPAVDIKCSVHLTVRERKRTSTSARETTTTRRR